ncbi:MAG: condensation domain-containing protein [Planctomycetaceae bacterium]|nr:condensation domain-containing protein [Planctomycetaceae bacterium]
MPSGVPSTSSEKPAGSGASQDRRSAALRSSPARYPATFADLSQFLIRHANTQQGHVVIRFDGKIDADRLEQALRRVICAEPILGCRFVEHWYRPYWQRRDDVDTMGVCIVTETDEPDQKLAEFMEYEVDPCRDPLIQVRIFRGRQDALCYKMNHIAGDAPSLMKVIMLVGEYYRKLLTEPAFVPEPNLRSRDHSEVIRHFSISHRFKVIRSFLVNQRQTRNLWLLSQDDIGPDRTNGRYFIRRFDPEVAVVAAKFAKKHRATMTVVLLAVLYRTMRRRFGVTGEDGLGVGTTVNHRNYLPPQERELSPVANLSGPSRMFVALPADAGLGEVVDVINEQFKGSHKAKLLGLNYPGVILSMPLVRSLFWLIPFGWLHWGLKRAVKPRLFGLVRASGISNAGELAPVLEAFEELNVIDAFATAPIYKAAGIALFVSQFRGAFTISIGATESLAKPEVCEAILDGMTRELAALGEA